MTHKVYKILAIDDRPENLLLLKGMFAFCFPEIQFIGARSGKEGISLCEKETPDTILLDIMMPDMDGFEVCRILKADKNLKHIPVVMVTAAMDEKPIRVNALNAGADSFLAKPIDESEFIAQIRAMLRIKESEDRKISENQMLEIQVRERTEELSKEIDERKRTEHQLTLSNAHLEKSQKATQKLMDELKIEMEERIQAEIKVHEHLIEQKQISEFSEKLVSINKLDDIYNYVGQKVFENCNNVYVFVTIYNIHNKTIRVKFVYGLENFVEKIKKLFGLDPFSIDMSIFDFTPKELADFRKQKFFELGNNGIHFLFARNMDKAHCLEMEAMLGVKKIYTIGFTSGEKVYGGVSILTKDENFKPQFKFIETMVNQASVALQRLFVEEKLRIREKLYRTLVETLPDAMIMTDLQAKIIAINNKVFEMFRLREDKFDPSIINIEDFIASGDKERLLANQNRKIVGENIGMQEYIGLRNDGSEFPIEVNSTSITDEQNKPYALISVIRDISKRKQAEKALIESRELYKLLAEKMTDVVWLMDLNGKSTFVSPSITKFTGFSVEEYLAQTIDNRFTQESASYGKMILAQEIASYKSSPKKLENYSINMQLEYVCKNGLTKWGDLVVTPLYNRDNGNDKLIGIHGVTRDINEKKQIEEALRINEKKFKLLSAELESILDHIPGMVFYKDTNNKFIHVNKIFSDTHNMSKEQIEGKNCKDIFPIEDAEKYYQDDLKVINLGKPRLNIEESVVINGTKRWVNTSKIPFRDENGKIIGIIGLSFDVTERRLAEKKLKESEQRYQFIVENTDDILWLMNGNLEFEYETPSVKKFLGYTEEEHMKLSFEDYMTPESARKIRAEFMEGMKNLQTKQYDKLRNKAEIEIEYIRKDKTHGLARITMIMIRDEQHNIKKIRGITTDITEQKLAETALQESEEKYRLLTRNIADVLMLFDRTGKILYTNDAVYNHLGYIPEFIIGKNIKNYLFKEDIVQLLSIVRKGLYNKSASENIVGRIKKKSSGFVWFDISILFIRSEKGRITEFQCVARNITDKIESEKKLDNERRKVMSALIDGQELERQRLSMELHDGIGQKLAAIKLQLENSTDLGVEETRESIIKVKTEFRDVIEEIRSISQNISPSILSHIGLLPSIALLINKFKESAKIELEFSTIGDFERLPEKTSFYIYRIIQEGLTNIAKHSKATIASIALIEKDQHLLVVIEDNGKGISIDEENYVKGNGLSNMRQRAFLLNGEMNIESGVDQGTVILIKIPK